MKLLFYFRKNKEKIKTLKQFLACNLILIGIYEVTFLNQKREINFVF